MGERMLTDYLQGLSAEGYQIFGAHPAHEYGQEGTRFTVYAPAAAKVGVMGDFNGWACFEMQRHPQGVWSIFCQGVAPGALYKYRIETAAGQVHDRMDPYAFGSEVRPNTASLVCQLEGYPWGDGGWMAAREKNYNRPLNIYEVHAGSWRRPGPGEFYNYEELGERLIPYLKEMGYTHLELMPLAEHPFDGSWGYQVAGYFCATSRYGTPQQLMALVDGCHRAGIGVILDFVPAHFVTDFYALHQYDGGFLYESEAPERRMSEWGTALFDFTKPHVLSFVRSAIDFWLTYYHFDGVRYDAVANLIYEGGRPERGINEPGIWFLKSCNFALAQRHPGVMLMAEDSSSYLKVTAPVPYGGLGFDYKWDLGWMHDTLNFLALPFSARPAARETITHSMDYFYQDIYILPFSHDEVVHGKKTLIDKLAGSYEEKFSQLRALYVYMVAHPGKKLGFMGNELGEFKEWNEEEELGWNLLEYPAHDAFHLFVRELHALYLSEGALYRADYHPAAFQWLGSPGAGAVFAFARSDLEGGQVLAVVNFSASLYVSYKLPVPAPGKYSEILQSDEARFGGKGVCNGTLAAKRDGAGYSLGLRLAPLSACLLKRTD